MNILFLTLSKMENINERGIYTDLVRELANRGINIYVVSPREKRMNKTTQYVIEDNIHLLRVKTGNITKVNFVEKGISTLLIERQYLKAIKSHFKGIHFDMIMYSTPPITFEKVVSYFKKNHNSITYLILKDIFPQNAVDIEIFNKNGLIYRYFRNKEKKLYKTSDFIGCMSQANVDYVLEHNNFIEKYNVEIFPNSIKPLNEPEIEHIRNNELLEKYNVPVDKNIFVYGGNLGKPQGIDFLLEVIERFEDVSDGYLLIVGSGTEYNKIDNYIKGLNIDNVKLLEKLPKEDYDELLKHVDVGLIFLDRRFTIPNFPSRLTAYMEHKLPILAATDKNTDIKETLIKSESGYWVESGEIEAFINYANKLSENKKLREEMGSNARDHLDKKYDIRNNVDTILNHINLEG